MERFCGAVKVVEQVEIADDTSARAWLETQDHQTRVWFAVRCALRALPALAVWKNATSSGLAFATCRATLISAVVAKCPTAEMKRFERAARAALSAAAHAANADSVSAAYSHLSAAAYPALAAAYAAADSAAFAADSAARSAASAASAARSAARSAAFSAANAAATHDANAILNWQKLWTGTDQPEGLARAWDDLKAQWDADEADWSFWIEWYEGILNGAPLPWDLIQRIALEVSEADWDAGQKVVAERIAEIEATFLAERAPLAEKLDVNPVTGLFRAVPMPIENAALITTLVSRVQDALDDALHGSNGLNATSSETRILNRTFERYANDPQRVEMDFTSVAVGLRRQIYETDELPDTAAMLSLLEATEEGARGLRATHPEVAANRAILAQQVFKGLTKADKSLLDKARPILVQMSEGVVAEDFNADIPALVNDTLLPLPTGAPKLPGADPATRIFNRVSNMHLLLAHARSKGAAAADSDTNKTIGLVARYGGYTRFLYEIIRIGLRAMGVI